jgi:hypothetical protein
MTERIPPVVAVFADRLRELLDERLVGVYLGGSLVMGDFIEGSSEYDLLVVLSVDPSSADISRLAASHPGLRAGRIPREMLSPAVWPLPSPGRESSRDGPRDFYARCKFFEASEPHPRSG